MNVLHPRRLAVIAGPLVVGGLVLGACGDDASSSPQRSTIVLDTGSTDYVTRPPATTTPPIDEAGVIGAVQEYTIQTGDYPLKVADDFGVELEDLVNFNGWASANEFPFPGSVIQIPPTATSTGAGSATAQDAGEAATEGEVAGETIPDAGDNCEAGTYTIAEGDVPIRVAEKFDVTLEALAEANAGTSGYSSFFVGLEIVIPAKADC